MNETYELVGAKGDETGINLVTFLIHFEKEGKTTSHYSDLPLPVSLSTDSTSEQVISSALSVLGLEINPIREHAERYIDYLLLKDNNQTTYLKSLDSAKEDKHRERLLERQKAINNGFSFNGHIVASDLDSRMLIQGAVQLAQMAIAAGSQEALDNFASSLNNGWRAFDDSIVATDASGIIALGQALSAHIATCDSVSQTHKTAINSAITVAEVESVDVTSGYLQ